VSEEATFFRISVTVDRQRHERITFRALNDFESDSDIAQVGAFPFKVGDEREKQN
jgi:hypothetical protein